jgi:hypothetical protein
MGRIRIERKSVKPVQDSTKAQFVKQESKIVVSDIISTFMNMLVPT